MPYLTLPSNNRLFYLDKNPDAKEVAILFHGLGANSSSWMLQIPDLTSAGYRVLAPDSRGFGQSDYPGSTSIVKMAEDFAYLLQQNHTQPAHVVGISLGGAQAIQLALDFPQFVRSLTLVNTFASLRPEKPSLWFYYAFRLFLVHTLGIPTQAKFVTKNIFPHPDQEILRQELTNQILCANPSGYRAVMRSLAFFNVEKRLHELNLPVLVISGSEDRTVSLHNQQVLVDKIPESRHKIIPGAGHAVTADQPALFNQILLDFLSSLPDQG